MLVAFARDVEAVGIGKLRRVPVRRRQQDHRLLALLQRRATDLHLLQRDAACELHRRVIAQYLLDCALGQRRVVPQLGELIGVAQQRQRAVADQVHRRLVTGNQQQDARRQQLLLAQLVPFVFGGDQRADQVVLRVLPPLSDQAAEVVPERFDHVPTLLLLLRRQRFFWVEAAGRLPRPLSERDVVFHRHAQHFADHCHGQRIGEVFDYLQRPLLRRRVQQLIDTGLDTRPQPLHHARRERLVYQPAQSGVVRRIEKQERWLLHDQHLGIDVPLLDRLLVCGRVSAIAARARIA